MMAHPSTSQGHVASPASKMERGLVLWAKEGGELEDRFRDIENREMEAFAKAQEDIRAKSEARKLSLSTKLSPEEIRDLTELTETAVNAELASLRQEYDLGREKRARIHAEDIKRHHEKIQSLMAVPNATHTPAVNPFSAQTQHNNSAYQSNGANHAYSNYASAPAAAPSGHGATVAGATQGYSASNPKDQMRQSPHAAGGPAQSYSRSPQFYQQSRAAEASAASHGALQSGHVESNRSPHITNHHPDGHVSRESQRRQSHGNSEWRESMDKRAGINQRTSPAQSIVPSQYVLPSQRSNESSNGAHEGRGPAGASDRALSQHHQVHQPQRQFLESGGSQESNSNISGRRVSGMSASPFDVDNKTMERSDMSHRAKRKADDTSASPNASSPKRMKGWNVLTEKTESEREMRPRTAGSASPQVYGQTNSRRLPSKRRASAGGRTITFDEVYQNGTPQYKHLIVEFPANSRLYYILRCDEHEVHFNATNPLAGAAKHLASAQHGNMTKEHANAIEKLGWRIVDCNPEKAQQNNAMVKEEFERGYKPHNRNFLTKRDRKSLEGGGLAKDTPSITAELPPMRKMSVRRQENIAPKPAPSVARPTAPPAIITYPVPGQLYRAFWSEEKRNYAVIVLPWGDLSRVGFTGTLGTTGLLTRAPKCYVTDRMVPKILGWSPGFEDGGPLVDKREFPVCYFDQRSSVGWVRAKDLRPFEFENPDSVPHFQDAITHFNKVKELGNEGMEDGRAERELDERNMDDKGPSPREKGSKTPTPADSTPKAQEDEAMTDAPPAPGYETDSYRASEDINTETEADTDSRRTSISHKAVPLATGQDSSKQSPVSRTSPAPANIAEERVDKDTMATVTVSEAAQDKPSPAAGNVDVQVTEPRKEAPLAISKSPAPQREEPRVNSEPRAQNDSSILVQSTPLPPRESQDKQAETKSPSTPKPELPSSSGNTASDKSAERRASANNIEDRPTTIFATGLGSRGFTNGTSSGTTAEKWRAVRAPSNDAASKPRPQTAEPRPTSAGSIIALGSRSAPNQSPAHTPSGSPALSKASCGLNAETFDVSRFEDDRLPEGVAGSVLLSLDKEAKSFQGKLEDGTPVLMDISKIEKIVRTLGNGEKGLNGDTAVATIHYAKDDLGSHTQVLVFKPRNTMGSRGLEIGSIHARRLARLAININPDIEWATLSS